MSPQLESISQVKINLNILWLLHADIFCLHLEKKLFLLQKSSTEVFTELSFKIMRAVSMHQKKENDISEQCLIMYPSVSVSITAYFSVLCFSHLSKKLVFL